MRFNTFRKGDLIGVSIGLSLGIFQSLVFYSRALVDPITVRLINFLPQIIILGILILALKKRWARYLLLGVIAYNLTTLLLINVNLSSTYAGFLVIITVASIFFLVNPRYKSVLEGTYRPTDEILKPPSLSEIVPACVISFPFSLIAWFTVIFTLGLDKYSEGTKELSPSIAMIFLLPLFALTLFSSFYVIYAFRKYGRGTTFLISAVVIILLFLLSVALFSFG